MFPPEADAVDNRFVLIDAAGRWTEYDYQQDGLGSGDNCYLVGETLTLAPGAVVDVAAEPPGAVDAQFVAPRRYALGDGRALVAELSPSDTGRLGAPLAIAFEDGRRRLWPPVTGLAAVDLIRCVSG